MCISYILHIYIYTYYFFGGNLLPKATADYVEKWCFWCWWTSIFWMPSWKLYHWRSDIPTTSGFSCCDPDKDFCKDVGACHPIMGNSGWRWWLMAIFPWSPSSKLLFWSGFLWAQGRSRFCSQDHQRKQVVSWKTTVKNRSTPELENSATKNQRVVSFLDVNQKTDQRKGLWKVKNMLMAEIVDQFYLLNLFVATCFLLPGFVAVPSQMVPELIARSTVWLWRMFSWYLQISYLKWSTPLR